ncbi:MAG TPA: alpha-amylase family glycosyl hydrolase [Anaerolineae bacterium]|nr:alpha-amylase family glycosyl hydrolase [Anaerolineae bacterium]HQH38589.1 alpha-amylase family glycosyl hydrolase [Anaerolineae bacterium]
MQRQLCSIVMLLALLAGVFTPPAAVHAAPTAAPAAPSRWCVAGSFQGWNNASTPLYDDGTHGDVIPEDGIFSLDYTVAAADRYEWKVVKCGDWGTTHPAQNAWFNTAAASQKVKFTFDTNDHSGDAGWDLLPAQNIVNVVDTLPISFTAVGDFQGWNNANSATAMTYVGSGIYYLAYSIATPGDYNGKVVATGTWDGFGADGRSTDAANIAFTTATVNETVIFLLDTNTGRMLITHNGSGTGNWCLAGGMNDWNNTADSLYDDGTHGDLIGGDGIFSLDYTVTTAGRVEWKVVECNNWGHAFPADNAWVNTGTANQTVKFTFDTNNHVNDAGWKLLPAQNIVNAYDDLPTSLTAVGSFQSWNNADPATAMTAAGQRLYALAYTIPTKGNYSGKFTTTGSWDAWGADGRNKNAQNIDFTTTAPNQTVYFVLDLATGRGMMTVSLSPAPDDFVMAEGLAHDSRDDFYRQPFGAVPTGTDITLRFRTFANDVTGVKVRLWNTALGQQTLAAMTKVTTIPGKTFDYDIWELSLTAPDSLTILYYRFIVNDGTDIAYYEDDDLYDGGLGRTYAASPDASWQIDVYDPAFNTPDWFKDAVVYQIFPDRFRNGVDANDPISGTFFYNETPGVLTAPQWNWIVPDPRVAGEWEGSYSKLFYGGDLQGIIDKLDYLHEMGVTALYLNPIFESPSNHKYDTTDYKSIDDAFGDPSTFITLTQELHDRGMHLILDGVFNHTSSDSTYFDRYGHYGTVGACEALDSPYRSWYYFRPASPAGSGPCAGDTTYEAWWGYDSLPKLNTTNVPAVRSYIYSDTQAVARYWLEQGADGWRLDVAGDVDPSFWRDWRDDVRAAKADAITIAEEWGDASRFMLGDQLDSTMNYRFRNAIIGVLRETDWTDTNSSIKALKVSEFDSVLHSLQEDYPPEAFYALMNLVGSHDVNRVLIPLDQDGDPTDDDYSDGKARQRALAIMQMTLPGAPTIYYGDEVSLVGYGEASAGNEGGVFYSDPYNRQPYPWSDEPGYDELPAWRQADLAMRDHYSATAAIRNAHPALRTGSFDTLLVDDEAELYAYGRRLDDDVVIVAVNLGVTTQTLTIPIKGYLPLDGVALTDALNGGAYATAAGQLVVANVPPMWGAILTVDEGQDITAPPAPTHLAAVEGAGTVTLTWDAVTAVASYTVFRSYVSGGGYEALGRVDSPTTTYVDDSVTNGTLYYYVVNAADADGNEGDFSNEVSALPHYTIGWANLQWPSEITHTIGITPTENIYGQVYIEGVTSEPGATPGLLAQIGYGAALENCTAWMTWVDAAFNVDAGNNDEFQAQLLPEQTGEFFYLYRYSTTGGRDWVYAGLDGMPSPGELHVLASADTIPPAVPQNLRVVHWGTDHITPQWEPVADADLAAYDLYRYGEGEASTDAVRIARVPAPATLYTDTNVTVDHTYTYTVQAVDTALNKSAFSNPTVGRAEARQVEVRFRVTVPPFTPPADTIYIAGDNAAVFGASWNPSAMRITRLDANTWAYTVTVGEETALQYKYTRGSWDVVENWGTIVGTENRHLTTSYGAGGVMLVEDVVYNWRDPLVVEHYPEADATTWDTGQPIWALISRPIDPARVTASTFVVEQVDNGVVPGALGVRATTFDPYPDTAMLPYLSGSLVFFTPTTALTTSNQYRVTLVAGGYHDEVDMQANYAWTFGLSERVLYLPLVMRVYAVP